MSCRAEVAPCLSQSVEDRKLTTMNNETYWLAEWRCTKCFGTKYDVFKKPKILNECCDQLIAPRLLHYSENEDDIKQGVAIREAANALLLLASSSHHRHIPPSPPPAARRHDGLPRGDARRKRDKKVSIGSGNVTVRESVLKRIDWSDSSKATRKLLMETFEPNILATHCLSGKASPAFADRQPKKRLNPKLVDDIVYTVSTKCSVSPSIVRGFIRSKCADEAKLMRKRQKENVSPFDLN